MASELEYSLAAPEPPRAITQLELSAAAALDQAHLEIFSALLTRCQNSAPIDGDPNDPEGWVVNPPLVGLYRIVERRQNLASAIHEQRKELLEYLHQFDRHAGVVPQQFLDDLQATIKALLETKRAEMNRTNNYAHYDAFVRITLRCRLALLTAKLRCFVRRWGLPVDAPRPATIAAIFRDPIFQ